MNGIISWWARNTVAANLLMLLIIACGIGTYLFSIEREVFPNAKLSIVNVSVAWPGASARDVEEQIVVRLEEAISGIDNVKEMTATAREGSAQISVEMVDGANFDTFQANVKARVDSVSNLPQSSFPPIVSQLIAQAPMAWITLSGDPAKISELELNRLSRVLRDDLAAQPGSSPLVEIQGFRTEEVSVEVTEGALRRYGLTFDDVARAIRGASINQSSGEVRTATGDIPLAVRQLADSAIEFEAIVIRRNPDGSVITVGDVATVQDGFDSRNFIRRIDGFPGRTLQVLQPEDVDIVASARVIDEWIARKNEEGLPDGVELKLQFSMSEMYFGRMELVGSNAFVGLILVLIILVLFLRPAVAFWVAMGIAISFAGTFIFLPAVGVSMNMLSMFGMLLVIGIVVDDALIVGESIHRQTERGIVGVDAAIIGSQIVLKPVVFAVLTTIIMFSPFIFIGGGIAEFTKSISWTVTFALIFSLIESFLILPAHLSHLKKPNPTGFLKMQSKVADSLLWVADKIYRPIIRVCLELRYFTVIGFIGFFFVSLTILSSGWLPFNFMPEVEGRQITLNIDMQRGTPFPRTLQVYEQIQAATDELTADLRERNGGNDVIESVEIAAWPGGLFTFLLLTDADSRTEDLATITERWREMIGDIPDAEDINLQSTINDDNNRFAIGLQSTDLDQLTAAVEEVKTYFASVGELYDIGDSFESNQDEIQFSLKPGAERFGLTIGEISRQVGQAFYGEEAQRLPRGGQDVRVMVRYPLEVRESLDSLSNFRVRTPDGREIALEAVADVTYAPAIRFIRRTDRTRSAFVWSRIREGSSADLIRREFYETVAPELTAKYPSVGFRQRGGGQEEQEFMQELRMLFLLALFCMYMLLAIAFSSYFQPILIMMAIPFGFMGATFGHILLQEPFAMFSVFGIVAAAGVVVNDNLVLVDYVNRLRREGAGAMSALIEAGVVRFRPILLTSLTTFVGMMPILMEQSFDAQFLRPTVISLSFAILFALFTTLLFVPALYAVGADIARFFRGLWTGVKQPALGEGASKETLPEIDPETPRYPEGGNDPSAVPAE